MWLKSATAPSRYSSEEDLTDLRDSEPDMDPILSIAARILPTSLTRTTRPRQVSFSPIVTVVGNGPARQRPLHPPAGIFRDASAPLSAHLR